MLRYVQIPIALICLTVAIVIPAQDNSAMYKVTFTGNWNLQSTPGGVPGSAHYTTIAGGTHNSSVDFWKPGAKATSGMEALAELGSTPGFISEINASSHSNGTFTKGTGFAVGTASFNVTVAKTHPLITLATMIGPSPDWFVGLSSHSLLDGNSNFKSTERIELFAYDAGTENGSGWSLGNSATVPQGVITSLKGKGRFSNVPMAYIDLERTDTPPTFLTISSIERPSGQSRHTNADSVTWEVTFSEAAAQVGTGDFVVNGSTATISSVSDQSTTKLIFDVVASGGNLASLNGTISLGLSSSQDIQADGDATKKLSTTLPSTAQSYVIDNRTPTVSSISPTRVTTSPFKVTITFSETLQSNSFNAVSDVTSQTASVTAPTKVGSAYEVTVTPTDATVSSTITLNVRSGAGTDLAGNTTSAYSEDIVFIVPTPPIITAIERPESQAQHTNADSVTWVVTFNETVSNVSTSDFTVSGTTATVSSASAQTDSTTKYDVEASGGDLANLNDTITLGLASNQNIEDSEGTALSTTIPDDAENYVIDNLAPTVSSVTPTEASSSPFDVTIVFSETLRADSFSAEGDVSSDTASVSTPQKSESNYTVSVTPANPNASSTITLEFRSGAAVDLAGNASAAYETDITYTIPVAMVESVSATSRDATYSFDEDIEIQVQFSKAVAVTGTPQLQLSFSKGSGLANYESGSGTTDLLFGYTITDGVATEDLGYLSTSSLILNGGTIRDVGGQSADLTLPTPGGEGSLSNNSAIVITERPVAPSFGDETVADQAFYAGRSITSLTLPSATGGTRPVTYQITPDLPAGLSFDAESLQITGTPENPSESTAYSLTVTDSDDRQATLTFNITVVSELEFTSTPSQSTFTYELNAAIEQLSLPEAEGGLGTLTYSLTPPTLPQGLTLNTSERLIAGTPTETVDGSQYAWTVTDDGNASISWNFAITVIEVLELMFMPGTEVSDQRFFRNQQIEAFTLPLAAGGSGELSYELTPDLPDGMSLDEDSRIVSGTPRNLLEITEFTWTVSDESGETTSITFEMSVIEDLQPSFSADTSIMNLILRKDADMMPVTLPEASGGNDELTYTLSPELPTGVQLDIASRVISGTPTEAMEEETYTWQASDTDGDVATLSFSIRIVEFESLSFGMDVESPDHTFIQHSRINPFRLPEATGGFGELNYQLDPELPSGLSIGSDGFEVSGTPRTVLQKTSYTWMVSGGFGETTQVEFTITVQKDLHPEFDNTIRVEDLIAIQGQEIQPIQLPAATGGNGSLTYTLSPALPAGLEFVAVAQIRGTPSEEFESTTFTWQVTDDDGDFDEIQFLIEVQEDLAPDFGRTIVADQSVIQNDEIEPIKLPSAIGGNGELSYSLQPESVPGISLNAATRVLAGAPSTYGVTEFTWRATDIDGDTAELTFTLTVLEDLQPSFANDAQIEDQTYTQDSQIPTLYLPRGTGGNGELTHTLEPELPDGLLLENDAFVLSGTPSKPLETTSYTWQAEDIDGDAVSIQFTITIDEDLQPEFADATFDINQFAIQNSPIERFTLPLASGGNGELSYRLEPSLPAGLDLDEAMRVISGTPTAVQAETDYMWMVADADGDEASFVFSITVDEDLMPQFAQDAAIEDREYIVDSSIETFTLPEATGGNGEITYSLTPELPDGLSMDAMARQISGTPQEELPTTEFTWQVQDEDGDSATLTFNLTVDPDSQPEFTAVIADMTYLVGNEIAPLNLPTASGGNGELSYTLTGTLPSGLILVESSQSITGTPIAEQESTSYEWTVTDIDGDMASTTFSITVHPQIPIITGGIGILSLFAGGSAQDVDVSSVIDGTVTTWRATSSDESVVSISAINQGRFSATPRSEGQAMIVVSAANVTGEVSLNIAVSVTTSSVEQAQLDSALNMQANALLSSTLSVFKRRVDIHGRHPGSDANPASSLFSLTESVTGNQSLAQLASPFSSDIALGLNGTAPHSANLIRNNPFSGPIHVNHDSSKWSMWAALNLDSFTTEHDESEVDGGMSSQYLGADVLLSDNVFAGVAVARHSSDSSYTFSNEQARGDGELDTTLTGFYPYLNLTDNNRFTMHLIGGFATGETTLSRSHVNQGEESADASANILAAGLEYVVWSRNSLHISLLGDAGSANISTEGDGGLLGDRESSSSRISFGTGISLSPDLDTGTMTTTLDIRFANAGGDGPTGSGLEIGGTLSYFGDQFDFMADARALNYSADDDVDVSQSSLSARLRFKANSDASGLSIAVTPRISSRSSVQDQINFRDIENLGFDTLGMSGSGSSIQGEIGFGIPLQRKSTMLTPRVSWTEHNSEYAQKSIGANYRFSNLNQAIGGLSFDFTQHSTQARKSNHGVKLRFELQL